MANGSLGTVYGTIRMEVGAALAAFAAVNRARATTVGALRASSAAVIAASRGFTTAGLIAAAGIGYAINAAADFEKKLDFFGAVSNSTAEEMEAVRKKALELGEDTRFSATQIADSFVELGKAGVSAKDIIDGIGDAVTSLAAAGDIPLDKAANIITSSVQTFQLPASDAVRIADLLAGAANSSTVEIEDLGVSLKYVGGVANSISLPVEDVVDALALLGKAGIRGSTAGTSLRQILVSLTGTSKRAKGVLEDLGIITADGANKFFDAEGKAKPLAEIFEILRTATAGMSEEQRLAAFKIIFNNRALAAASILSRDGAAGFAEMNKEISKVTAADVASKRLDNLSGDIEILKGNLQTLFIQAGSPFQETLRTWVQGLTDLVKAFNDLSPSTQGAIIQTILWTGAVFLALGIGLRIVGMFLRLWSILIRIGPAFKLLAEVLVIVSRGLWAMSLALLTTPAGWIILAILAIIAIFIVLWIKSEAFREFWKELGKDLVDIGKAIIEWFKGLPDFFKNLWEDISGFFVDGFEKTKAAWNKFTELLSTGWDKTVDGLKKSGQEIADFFKELPGNVVDGLVTAGKAVLEFFNNLPYLIGFAIGFVLGTLIRWGAEAIAWAWDAGSKIIGTLVDFFINLPGKIWELLKKLAEVLGDFGEDAGKWATEVGQKIWDGIVYFFTQLPGDLREWLRQAGEKLVEGGIDLAKKAGQGGQDVFNALIDWFKSLPGNVSEWLTKAGQKIVDSVIGFAISAGHLGFTIMNGIKGFLEKIPGLAWDALKNTIQAFKDMVSAAWDAAKDFAQGLWDGFKKGLGINSPSYIEEAMFAIRDTMNAETANVKRQVRTLQSLGRGINSLNPVVSSENADAIALSTQAMTEQLRAMQTAQASLNAANLSASIGLNRGAGASSLLGRGQGVDGVGVTINMTVYNPQAEPASSTAARKMRTLSEMGAFK